MSKFSGWLGATLLALCGLPELILTIQNNHCNIGWGMLSCWLIGELLVLIHVSSNIKDKALLLNYTTNLLIVGIMMGYKIKEIL